jgi:hypothetical protein
MGFLDKLKPQPRWKHADPLIRLEALRELDDSSELALLAERDPDLKVRRAAVARVADPAVLGRLAASDADSEIRDRAADRLTAIASSAADSSEEIGEAVAAVAALADPKRLAAVARSEAPAAVRDRALERIADSRALGAIARHARVEATALAALARIQDSAELLDVALNSDHRDVAMQAFERVVSDSADGALLRSIEVRAQQKAVSRRARTMIQDIEAAEAARQAAALERQRRESMLCDAVEHLVDLTDGVVIRSELARLSEAWQSLGGTESASAARYEAATVAAHAVIARREREAEEALDRQRARAEAIATRIALCERVETLDGDDVLAQLIPIEEEWRSLLPLVGSGPEADRLAERFALAVAACRRRHELGTRLTEARSRLETLVAESEALLSLEDGEAATARWHALDREARGLVALLDEALRPAEDQTRRLTAVGQAFADREAARRVAADKALQDHLAQLQRLSERARRVADAETITLREGERLMRDLVAAIDGAPREGSEDIGQALGQLRKLQETIAPRVRELRELDDWRRFANAQRQEQLITLAEAIVASLRAEAEAGQPSDLAATARALRELHAQWHDVAEAPRQSAQRLWDRFRTATDFIRSRCEGYFQQLRQEREASLEQKQAIVAEAEQLAESSDWAKTAGRLQELQTQWQALGRLGREAERELAQRFRTACNTFFARRREDLADRKKVWTENYARKDALCARVEALVVSTDWEAAAAEVKRLQAEWKTIGPVRKNKSEAIWQRFRTAADQFFDRYHHRHEIALSAKLSERETIVVELESLVNGLSGEVPDDFAQQVQNLRASWNHGVPVPLPGMKPLADRWHAALSTILAARPDAFAGTDLDQKVVVQRMEKLVARVEALLGDTARDASRGRLSQTELLAERLRSALASNAMGGRGSEESKWRAAADVVRDAQSAWHRLPPVSTPEAHALEMRFREACRRVSEHTRRHRPPQDTRHPSPREAMMV